MTDKMLSKKRLAEIARIRERLDGTHPVTIGDLLSHIRAQAELLAMAETALDRSAPEIPCALGLSDYEKEHCGTRDMRPCCLIRATLTRIRSKE